MPKEKFKKKEDVRPIPYKEPKFDEFVFMVVFGEEKSYPMIISVERRDMNETIENLLEGKRMKYPKTNLKDEYGNLTVYVMTDDKTKNKEVNLVVGQIVKSGGRVIRGPAIVTKLDNKNVIVGLDIDEIKILDKLSIGEK